MCELILNSTECKWSLSFDNISTTYDVKSGPLAGIWFQLGTVVEADTQLEIRMVSRLKIEWQKHFDECKLLGKALRNIEEINDVLNNCGAEK